MAIVFENTTGLKSKTAKLNREQVLAIRKEYAEGKRGKERSRFYGVSPSAYNNCGAGKTYKDVE